MLIKKKIMFLDKVYFQHNDFKSMSILNGNFLKFCKVLLFSLVISIFILQFLLRFTSIVLGEIRDREAYASVFKVPRSLRVRSLVGSM